jgi:hypothetical protein
MVEITNRKSAVLCVKMTASELGLKCVSLSIQDFVERTGKTAGPDENSLGDLGRTAKEIPLTSA